MVDYTKGGTATVGYTAQVPVVKRELTIDFRETPLTAASSPHLLFNVPAGCRVLGMGYTVERAEGGTATFDLGDGAAATQYISNGNGNSVGKGVSLITAAKVYTTADTVDLTLDHDYDNARIKFTMLMEDYT